MRLATEFRPVYGKKIIRDVRGGAPPEELLGKVLDVAKYLGNVDVIAPRVEDTRRTLGLLSATSRIGRPSRRSPSANRSLLDLTFDGRGAISDPFRRRIARTAA